MAYTDGHEHYEASTESKRETDRINGILNDLAVGMPLLEDRIKDLEREVGNLRRRVHALENPTTANVEGVEGGQVKRA